MKVCLHSPLHQSITVEHIADPFFKDQEQAHALAANGVLANAGNTTLQLCQNSVPVDNFDAVMALAKTFADIVLGVLPLAQGLFASDGGDESALVPIVGSIFTQEGEQSGHYRFLREKVASAAPLLTDGAPEFSYTAISRFIIPGSCPSINIIGLAAFPALIVETILKAMNSTQLFGVNGTVSAANATMVYISGQNVPVSVSISNVNT